MKVFLVDTFTVSKRINMFHYCLFHGKDARDDVEYPDNPSHCLGDDLSRPVKLSMSGTPVPEVFMPSTSLIVSAKVRDKMAHLPNVVFLPVVFEKLVDYPYHPGDLSYFKRPAYLEDPEGEDPEALLDRLPDAPRLHKAAGRYYEAVIGVFDRVWKKYKNRQPVAFKMRMYGQTEERKIKLSRPLISDYPLLWCEFGILFAEEAFRLIEPHLDADYFAVATSKIP